jgi:tRNA dimethylallyltransferase
VADKKPLLVLCGPTAVGKSALAMDISQETNAEIVSADAYHVYRGMDIGTAKPSVADRARVAHHMIDVCDPQQPMNVAAYKEHAVRAIADVHARGKLPVLVGGSGLFFSAVIYDYAFANEPGSCVRRAHWVAQAAAIGSAALHAQLVVRDPIAAERIHPNDTVRIVRAHERCDLFGSAAHGDEKMMRQSPYTVCMIALTMERAQLYSRINARVDNFVRQGLKDEALSLMERYRDAMSPVRSAIGYKEWAAFASKRWTLEQTAAAIAQHTRQFSKRQLSWLRAMPDVQWIDATSCDPICQRHQAYVMMQQVFGNS